MSERDHARILIYSHDTFGLGRLRRCLAVANALVGQFKGLFVLIISGAQMPTGMGLRARVDFVKIPSVIKLYNGQYTSMEEHIDLRDTMAIRSTITRNTAESFNPDLMIVDGEPLGMTEEIRATLEFLRGRGCRITLALPDLMDTPEGENPAGNMKPNLETIVRLYDRVWIYGSEDFARPLHDLGASADLLTKVTHTGYLRRNIPRGFTTFELPFTNPYILVTAGDEDPGTELLDQVLTAYEHDPSLPHPALFLLSPLLPAADRKVIMARAARQANVSVLDFGDGPAALMPGAVGVVTVANYDALCQTLSFDKRVIFVANGDPELRTRGERAARLQLARHLSAEQAGDPRVMAQALHAFATGRLPSQSDCADMLGGLDTICLQVGAYLERDKELETREPSPAQ